MIPRYTDLAANERTYLAWMRTALALIAFGFILERFDLFVRALGGPGISRIPVIEPDAGIVLALLGLIIMLLSTTRFVVTTRRLKNGNEETYGSATVLITGGIFILLAVFVLLYATRFLS